jgi:hypothetical protein
LLGCGLTSRMRSRVLTLASMVSVAITTAKHLFISGYEDSGLF